MDDDDRAPASEIVGWLVSAAGLVLTVLVSLPAAVIAGTIHTTTSLAWGLPLVVIPILMGVGGLIFVPPRSRRR